MLLTLGSISVGVLISFGSYLNNYLYNQKILRLLSDDFDGWREWRESSNYSTIEISGITFRNLKFGKNNSQWFDGFRGVNFNNVIFDKCDFVEIGFGRNQFKNVQFQKCNFERVGFEECVFSEVVFLKSIFQLGVWNNCLLEDSTFRSAQLVDLNLEVIRFKEVSFEETLFWECIEDEGVYESCNFQNVAFKEMYLHCKFRNTDLSKVKFIRSDFMEIELDSNSKLSIESQKYYDLLKQSQISSGRFLYDLSGKNLINFDFSGYQLSDINFTNTNLRGAKFEYTELHECNFTGANLADVSFKGADIHTSLFAKVKGWRTINFEEVFFFNIHLSSISAELQYFATSQGARIEEDPSAIITPSL